MAVKSYLIENEKLMSEWDWDANADLDPKKLTSGSNKKAWWKCSKCGGKWYTTICGRTGHDHTGCPYCAGQKVLKGYNDLATKCPELISQWHPTKNGNLSPDSIMPNSKTKVWWLCERGHEFEQAVVDRKQHPKSCPICSGQRVVKGINDLETRYPNVAKEWDYTKNKNIVPSNITWGSNKKFWWKCLNCGHEWQARVSDRTRGHNGCPACSNRVLIVGINDLSTKYPKIAKEWNYAENGDLAPNDFIYDSKKIVWWKCPNGHEYTQTLYNRTCKSKSCPYCKVKIAKDITKQLIKKTKATNKKQVRIYRPINDLGSLYPEIAKEWHPTKNGDLKPSEVSVGSKRKVWWICPKGHEYEQYVGRKTLRSGGCPICSGHRLLSGFNDFETKFPEVAAEWHPTKNGSLKPSEVISGSGKRVWWRCPVGHDYQAVVRDRGIGQTGCPICNKRKTSSFPEQAILYYIKKIYPNAINKYKECFDNAMEFDVYIPELKVAIEYDGCNWHKTEEEHKREVKKYKISKENGIHLIRIKEKNGVQWDDTYDEIYYVKPVKRNNLYELEKIINYVLNSLTVSIDNLIENWQISSSHFDCGIFKYKPFKLFHHGVDVNLERDKLEILNYLSKIENSLSDLRPDVVTKWNYERNGDLVPNMFSVGSNEKVWWKCPDCGHEWQSSIVHITKSAVGCPICALKYRGKSFSVKRVQENGSLAINKPKIAAQWHPTKNGGTTPFDITEKNCNLFWWLCPKCGHEWQSSPNNRSKGSGCPACSGRVPKQGINDLLTKYPDIARLWNYEKNGEMKPNQFLPGSSKKVWWKCDKCGAEWQRVIDSQVKHNKCPSCGDNSDQIFMFNTKKDSDK